MRERPPSIFWVIPNHQRGASPALPRGRPMTVPSNPNDESPHRLLQPAPGPALPASLRPLGGAAPDELRVMIEAAVHAVLEREFAAFLGAAPHERTPARRGVRNGTRART